MRNPHAAEQGVRTHDPDMSAEAVKTVRCLLSYLRVRHSLPTRSGKAERQRVLRYCQASYEADVAALQEKLN
jgi:hypothetical protein